MPKLKNVTADELAIADAAASDMLGHLVDMANRISGGYCDDIESPIALARTFAAMGRDASHLSVILLSRAAMQEQKRELAALMEKRTAQE